MKHLNANRFSKNITQDDSFPAAQAMLYATGLKEDDFHKAQVGIVSNWYEGNPCNMHLRSLGDRIKKSVKKQDFVAFQFNTISVSDGMSMGTLGMRYSLPSRELIADSIEVVVNAQHYDAVVAIPGCDKNMPGVLMALLRINRPSIIVYGGSIASGSYLGNKLNIVSAFEALGKKNMKNISNLEFKEIIQRSCPGAGSCGGMYTANTMACSFEAMGMTLPYSSSYLAIGYDKERECDKIGSAVEKILYKNIVPKQIVTKSSLKNAITLAIALGGSTNLILHILAIAKTAFIDLTLEDFQIINNNVPYIGNLKPSGNFLMEDLNSIGGIPSIMKYLLNEGLLNGDCMSITGNSIGKNLENVEPILFNQKIIYPLHNPIKKYGNFLILYGNLSAKGAVAKITGKEGLSFSGMANVFDSEEEVNRAILDNNINTGAVIVIRYVGPKGGPGMPEMLKPTAYIIGAGLKVALITDGRFSGGSHGFVAGHITPEAQEGGEIALVEDGDIITIDTKRNTITLELEDKELYHRKKKWKYPDLNVSSGYLYKYSKIVTSASYGCVTDKI
jgi:dihydroxy-acid dehydratase